jgi:hypothetical protein
MNMSMFPEEEIKAVAIYATADGGSAIVDLPLPLCVKETMPDGTSQWTGLGGATVWGVTAGGGTDYMRWHRSAMAGLSIVLSGAWEIEATTGERRILDTGDILVMLDTTGQGHRSRTLTSPCAVLGMAFDDETLASIRRNVAELASA